MRNKFPFVVLLLFILLLSCTGKCPYGAGNCLGTDNPAKEQWLLYNFHDYAPKDDTINNTMLSIRISQKRVMRGFISTGGEDRDGAFYKLLHVFSDIKTAQDPDAQTEYIFFDGSGKLDNDTTGGRLFDETRLFESQNYASATNDLHHQFRNIAQEMSNNNTKNKLYVIFSDGETSIRSNVRQNTNELTIIKDAVKDMLTVHPTLQIGILSLLADFNGEYAYDPGVSANIHNKRHLYAYCFFDKRYLPAFNRFCKLNKDNGGDDFLFNPQFSQSFVTTRYNQKIDGQENIAANEKYAAYPIAMKDNVINYTVQNEIPLSALHFSDSFLITYFKHSQTDTLVFKEQERHGPEPAPSINKSELVFRSVNGSAIFDVQYTLNYQLPVKQFVAPFLVNHNTEDNTALTISQLLQGDTLPTEGLLDMCKMILEALQVSNPRPLFHNYFQFSQVK